MQEFYNDLGKNCHLFSYVILGEGPDETTGENLSEIINSLLDLDRTNLYWHEKG